MRLLVVGAGSTGGYFGGRLAQARVFCPLRARARTREGRVGGAGRTAKPLRAPRGAEVGIDATRRLLPVIGRLRAGMVPTT